MCQRYLQELREVESEAGRVDMALLKRRLSKLYAESASGSIVDGRLPVELLTIHKAKGLEWDLVLVPGMERGGGQSHSVLLNWLEFDGAADGDITASVVLAPIGQKGTQKDRLSSWLTGIRANVRPRRTSESSMSRPREHEKNFICLAPQVSVRRESSCSRVLTAFFVHAGPPLHRNSRSSLGQQHRRSNNN